MPTVRPSSRIEGYSDSARTPSPAPPPSPRLSDPAASRDGFVTAPTTPQPSRSPTPEPARPKLALMRPVPPRLPPAPEDLSVGVRTVWMPDSFGVQRDFLGDMARLAVKYDFCLVVQVSAVNSTERCKATVQQLSDLTPAQMAKHVMFVEAGDAFSSWGEDNKILTVPGGKNQPTILYPPRLGHAPFDLARAYGRNEGYHPYNGVFQGAVSARNEGEDARAFAERVGFRSRCTTSYLEGGNVLTGEMSNGKPYALVGRDSVLITTFKQRQEDDGFDTKSVTSRRRTLENKGAFTPEAVETAIANLKRARQSASLREWLFGSTVTADDAKTFLAQVDLAHDLVARDLGLPREQVFVVSQPDFHIDMHMRPMNAGQVLVNDPRTCVTMLELLQKAPDLSEWQRDELKEMHSQAQAQANELSGVVDEIAEQLRAAGLTCVHTPGVMESGRRRANFMNGIPGRLPDGSTFYFTNASSLTALQQAVEAFFNRAIGITHVEFVGGIGGGPYQLNAAEESLDQSGGLDCREVHSSAAFDLGDRAA